MIINNCFTCAPIRSSVCGLVCQLAVAVALVSRGQAQAAGATEDAATLQGPERPNPDSGKAVSLREMLAWAAEHAPAVDIAQSQLGLAEAARAGATPLFPDNPFLHVGAGSKSEGKQDGPKVEGFLLQPVEIFGQRRLRLEAAERTGERLEAEQDAVGWRVHRQVHEAFHQALLARERAEVARRVLEFQQELLDYTKRRHEAGDIGMLPVRLTEADTAEARQHAIAAEQAHHSARLRLARVAGWPIEAPPEPAGSLDEPRSAPPLDQLVRLAERRHPALRARQARVAEAEAQSDLADREAFPDPMFGVGYGREQISNRTEQSIVGLIRLPLPLWRRNQAGRTRAEAELDIARSEQAAARFDLRARLKRAAAEVDAAAKRIEVYGEHVLPNFEDNLEMLRRGFELGEFDILEVSLARERFLRIQQQALDTHTAYFEAVADLEAQVGTELWPDEEHRP